VLFRWIERRPLVAKIESRRMPGEKPTHYKQGASIVFKDVELICSYSLPSLPPANLSLIKLSYAFIRS
jgi:hypothetical protein